jgi:hypothetical protein
MACSEIVAADRARMIATRVEREARVATAALQALSPEGKDPMVGSALRGWLGQDAKVVDPSPAIIPLISDPIDATRRLREGLRQVRTELGHSITGGSVLRCWAGGRISRRP